MVCHICYANRKRYLFPNVQRAMERRLEAFNRDPVEWVTNMSSLLRLLWYLADENDHDLNPDLHPDVCRDFRWFDSGDLQSTTMLAAMFDVAWCVPHGRFWLPTREVHIVAKTIADHTVPENTVIRLSANRIGAKLTLNKRHFLDPRQITTSTVGVESSGYQCPALKQGNQCGDCRACWDTAVWTVNYHQH